MSAIQDYIKNARCRQGWTQQDLATKAGLAIRTLAKAESGHQIKLSTAYDIFKTLRGAESPMISDDEWPEWVSAYLVAEAGPHSIHVVIRPVSKKGMQIETGDRNLLNKLNLIGQDNKSEICKIINNPDLLKVVTSVSKLKPDTSGKCVKVVATPRKPKRVVQ